jgi:ATP-dependent Clp protease ATP-binding subunit ClpC
MRRAVEKNIEDPLSEHLLRGDVREGDVVKVTFDVENKRLKFAADARPEAEKETTEESVTSS